MVRLDVVAEFEPLSHEALPPLVSACFQKRLPSPAGTLTFCTGDCSQVSLTTSQVQVEGHSPWAQVGHGQWPGELQAVRLGLLSASASGSLAQDGLWQDG